MKPSSQASAQHSDEPPKIIIDGGILEAFDDGHKPMTFCNGSDQTSKIVRNRQRSAPNCLVTIDDVFPRHLVRELIKPLRFDAVALREKLGFILF